MQTVHSLVVHSDVGAQGDILRCDNRTRLGDDDLCQRAHFRESCAEFLRHSHLGKAHASLLGHVLGEVTHPLQRAGDAERSDDNTQVGRYRLLERNQFEAALLDVAGQRVHLGVEIDHRFSERKIRIEERLGRSVHRRTHEPRHLDEVVIDLVKLLVIGGAHRGSWFVVGDTLFLLAYAPSLPLLVLNVNKSWNEDERSDR